jgi:RNA polymerase sigma-70 factor (ECF subfamily)
LTVVVLKVWQGMTFAEVASALDIPAKTAASRYRYAMEKLRQWLR